MVRLTIYNYASSLKGSKLAVEADANEAVESIKQKIVAEARRADPPEEAAKNAKTGEGARDLTPDGVVLYLGSRIMADGTSLDEYNVSALAELTLCMYTRVDVRVVVKVLRGERRARAGMNCFGVKYAPVLSLLMHKKIKFSMIDQQTVLELKRRILADWEFANKSGAKVSVENMDLLHAGRELNDNLCTLNELDCGTSLALRLIIPYGYEIKRR